MADGEIVERLIVEFDAKIDKVLTKLNGLNRSVHGSAKEIEKSFSSINLEHALGRVFDSSKLAIIDAGAEHLRIFGSALEPLGAVGIAAGAGVAAFAIAAEKAGEAAEWAESLKKTAENLGVTTDALQEFDFVALKSGISTDAMRESLKGLSEKIGQVQSGVAKAQTTKIFQALDITPDQLRHMGSVTDILPVIAQKLNELPPAERAGLAARLDVSPILPALEKLADKTRATQKEAHDLGLVLDEDLIKKGDEAAEKMKVASDVIDKNLKASFLALSPVIAEATGKLAEFLELLWAHGGGTGVSANDLLSPEAKKLFVGGGSNDQVQGAEAEFRRSLNMGGVSMADMLARLGMTDGRPKALLPPTAKHGAPSAEERRKAGDDAIAKAADEELKARQALTSNAQLRLDIALKLLDTETNQKVTDLEHEVTLKKISRADADKAEALIKAASGEQADLLRREAAFKIEDIEIEVHRSKVDALISQLTDEAAMAGTSSARRKIEAQILQLRQQQARDIQGTLGDRAVKEGSKTSEQAATEYNALVKTQAADTQRSVYDSFYGGVHGALEAAVKGGWPGLAQYMADKLEQNLLDAVANGLTNALIGGSGSGGGIIGAVFGAALGVPGFATGTESAPGGLAIVGENGPELVNLKQGSQVVPNGLLSKLGGSAPGAGGGVTLLSFNLAGAVMTSDLVAQMQRMANTAQTNATTHGAALGVAAARQLIPMEMAQRAGRQIR